MTTGTGDTAGSAAAGSAAASSAAVVAEGNVNCKHERQGGMKKAQR